MNLSIQVRDEAIDLVVPTCTRLNIERNIVFINTYNIRKQLVDLILGFEFKLKSIGSKLILLVVRSITILASYSYEYNVSYM